MATENEHLDRTRSLERGHDSVDEYVAVGVHIHAGGGRLDLPPAARHSQSAANGLHPSANA